MAWERFHHICRRALLSQRPGESLGKRIKTVDADPDSALYGAPLPPGSLPRRILDRIAVQGDENRLRQMLEFYASVNLTTETDEPLQLKRLPIYLAWVLVLLALIHGLHHFREMLGLTPFFDTFEAQLPSLAAWFRGYELAFVLVVVALLALALVMGHTLRRLADWPAGRGRGGLALILALPAARAAHADLEAAVFFPLGSSVIGGPSRVPSHLWKLEEEGIDIRGEVEALVRGRHRTLVEVCEKQMTVVYSFCILLIALTIALFLVGAFSP